MKCFKRKTIIVLILIMLISTGCSQTKEKVFVNVDYPYYEDLDSMVAIADTIIEGKILSSRVEMLDLSNNMYDYVNDEKLNPGSTYNSTKTMYTIYDVEITKIYKGDIKSKKEIVEIKQLGGETKELTVISSDKADIKKDSTYLFFLSTYDNVPASLINPTQGYYLVKENQFIGSDTNKIKINTNDVEIKVNKSE
ncbi:UNVERIFIED_CONTAM: hypothetical protein Cloal_0402 [Acetivibrio alkalicellulosi]